jgi:hypothetical protein
MRQSCRFACYKETIPELTACFFFRQTLTSLRRHHTTCTSQRRGQCSHNHNVLIVPPNSSLDLLKMLTGMLVSGRDALLAERCFTLWNFKHTVYLCLKSKKVSCCRLLRVYIQSSCVCDWFAATVSSQTIASVSTLSYVVSLDPPGRTIDFIHERKQDLDKGCSIRCNDESVSQCPVG